jgi:DNA excision repair protein ERCC-4
MMIPLSELSEHYGGDGRAAQAHFWENEYPAAVPAPRIGDFDLFNPGLKAYPIPAPIRLLADHCEPPELIALLKKVPNLNVEVTTLNVGHFVVEGAVAIVRKTPVNFAQGVINCDRRLFHQAQNMLQSGLRPVVLVEGDVYANRSMTIQQVDGMLSYLTMKGIHLFRARTMVHSASIIAKIARHMVFGLGYPDPVLSTAAPKNPSQTGAYLLSCIPGVSGVLSFRLIQEFGSVLAVSLASRSDLMDVEGVGEVIAGKILAALNPDNETLANLCKAMK